MLRHSRGILPWIVILLLHGSAFGAEAPVPATRAYREAYGPPPKTEAGQCIAAVVFLTGVGVSGRSDRLAPLPIFSVRPDTVIEEAARVVVEGFPVSARDFEPPRLFPAESKLLGVEVEAGVANVRVANSLPDADHPLATQALSHTLSQFDGIDSIRLTVEGSPQGDPESPDLRLLEPPPPPRLVDVMASVHPGEKPKEVDVLFDRPIEVASFSIRLADGTGLPGKTYTSMFDMAVVHRPVDSEVLREGLPLEIHWTVRDKTGRTATGTRDIPLRVYTRSR